MLKLEDFKLVEFTKEYDTLVGGANEIVLDDGTNTEHTLTVVCDVEGLNNSKTYGDWNDEGC